MSDSYTRFLILSSPRCGTHLLGDALGEHPAIVSHTEMFNPDWTIGAPFGAGTHERRILAQHVFCGYPPSIGAVGFRLHRHGAKIAGRPLLWQLLERERDLKVISLTRQNLLRRYLSYRIMREPKRKARRSVRMSKEELRAEFIMQEGLVAAFDARFERHPMLRVSYESLCDDWSRTIREVQVFLGLEPCDLRQTTTRNAARPLDEAIENLDGLAAAFAKTRWAWFFTAEGIRARTTTTVELPQAPNT